ncbi:MAG TPA: restriction endonuclease subunit S, partial [Myxococcota bacterium]
IQEARPRRFRPYPQYKESGVEWLRQVPAHWEAKRWRYCCKVAEGLVDPTDDAYGDRIMIAPNHVESGTGRILLTETAQEQGAISGKYIVKPGDLIYSKIRPALNKVCIADGDWLCSADMYPVQVTEAMLLPGFLLYSMLSDSFVKLMVDESMRVAMPKVNRDKLSACPLLLPPRDEQRAIAAFLDRETAKIDGLVARKERLIELLQEKRTALITRTVTRGLDPNVPMKDSGVEWLGEIPAHWEVSRTKRVARLESGHTPSRQRPEYWQTCTIPWFGLADVWQIRDGQTEYVVETAEKVSELGIAHSSARLLPRGTVLLSRTASVGFSAIMGVDMATTQDFVNWVCGERIRPEYLLYVFRSMGQEFRRLTMGSTHQTIYMPDAGQFSTPVPTVTEQERIVAFIRGETAKIDALIAKVREAIDRLKEFRTALISAAVTGKIDVREEVS